MAQGKRANFSYLEKEYTIRKIMKSYNEVIHFPKNVFIGEVKFLSEDKSLKSLTSLTQR